VRGADRSVRILVINKHPSAAINATIALPALKKGEKVRVFSYGIDQDEAAHTGTGTYRVQSSSAFGNFTLCPTNNKINDSLYGTEELQYCCGKTPQPLECVYMQGTPNDPVRFQPGGLPGDLVFKDGNPDNDYFGGNGELQTLIGGQGGGGGGSRVDSMYPVLWDKNPPLDPGNPFGLPPFPFPPPAPPCYPQLFIGFYVAPTMFDAKGGAGGGGGGSVLIRSFGDILISRTGHIDASGGDGGGGETVGASNYSGGGGGGSGGAVILQAAGDITIQADSNHRMMLSLELAVVVLFVIEVVKSFW